MSVLRSGHAAWSPDALESVLEAAVYYRQCGLSVLPLDGKRPHTRLIRRTHGSGSTKRLASRGATDDQIRKWFAEPGVNIGIFCGDPSGGLVVVDLDDCDLPPPGATLPLTPLVKTGRSLTRGYHLYYRGAEAAANRNFEGGEVHARAPKHVVAPPSVHPKTGMRYQWQLPLDEAPLADFSGVVIPERSANSARSFNNNPIRSTRDVLLGTSTTRDKCGDGWLERFDGDLSRSRRWCVHSGSRPGSASPSVCHPPREARISITQACCRIGSLALPRFPRPRSRRR